MIDLLQFHFNNSQEIKSAVAHKKRVQSPSQCEECITYFKLKLTTQKVIDISGYRARSI